MNSQSRGCFLDRPPFIRYWAPFYKRIFAPYIRPVLVGIAEFFTGKHSAAELKRLQGEFTQVYARIEQLSAELRRIPEKIEQLSAELRRIPEKVDSVYLNSLDNWGMMERSVTSSLRIIDKNVSREVYHLEQVRASHTELSKKLAEATQLLDLLHSRMATIQFEQASARADHNKILENLISAKSQVLLEQIQQQTTEREALWKQLEQLLLSLIAQAPVRVQAAVNSSNSVFIKSPLNE
jgi:hypothetical protein